MSTSLVPLLSSLLAALLLAACAAPPDAVVEQPSGGPELAIPPTPDGGPAPSAGGAQDLAFVAPTVDGGQLDASSLEGRDVVLWFWAPW